jgi:hypothetical protein
MSDAVPSAIRRGRRPCPGGTPETKEQAVDFEPESTPVTQLVNAASVRQRHRDEAIPNNGECNEGSVVPQRPTDFCRRRDSFRSHRSGIDCPHPPLDPCLDPPLLSTESCAFVGIGIPNPLPGDNLAEIREPFFEVQIATA